MTHSTLAANVYQYACPKCEVAAGRWCVRVQKTKREAPELLLDAHKERYRVWHAWERNRQFSLDLPLYSVRKGVYKGVIQPLESET